MIWFACQSHDRGLLASNLLGAVDFYQDGRVQHGKQQKRCRKVLLIVPEFALLLKLDQRWYLLWRDSVNAEDYRKIILQFKKEP